MSTVSLYIEQPSYYHKKAFKKVNDSRLNIASMNPNQTTLQFSTNGWTIHHKEMTPSVSVFGFGIIYSSPPWQPHPNLTNLLSTHREVTLLLIRINMWTIMIYRKETCQKTIDMPTEGLKTNVKHSINHVDKFWSYHNYLDYKIGIDC